MQTPQKSTTSKIVSVKKIIGEKCNFCSAGGCVELEKCNTFVSENLLFFLHFLKIQPFICFNSIWSTYMFYAFKRNATKERRRAYLQFHKNK